MAEIRTGGVSFSSMVYELKNVYKFRYVTFAFVSTSLKQKYRRSYLGFLWTVLTPMLHYLIMGLVFTVLMGNRRPDYFKYYFLGALFFAMISGVLNRSVSILIANENFIKKIYIPKLTFVLNAVGIELANFFLSASSLIFLGLIFGFFKVSPHILLSFFSVIIAAICLTGIACLFSLIAVYFRDFIGIVPVAIQAIFFTTPIIYDESMIPAKYNWLITYNPVYYFLKLFRGPLLDQTVPSIGEYAFAIIFSFLCLGIGLLTLIKFDNRIAFKL